MYPGSLRSLAVNRMATPGAGPGTFDSILRVGVQHEPIDELLENPWDGGLVHWRGRS